MQSVVTGQAPTLEGKKNTDDIVHTTPKTNRILVPQTKKKKKNEISLGTYHIQNIHIIIILYTYVRHTPEHYQFEQVLHLSLFLERRHHTRGIRRLAGS